LPRLVVIEEVVKAQGPEPLFGLGQGSGPSFFLEMGHPVEGIFLPRLQDFPIPREVAFPTPEFRMKKGHDIPADDLKLQSLIPKPKAVMDQGFYHGNPFPRDQRGEIIRLDAAFPQTGETKDFPRMLPFL
jgi:hypothetical protein